MRDQALLALHTGVMGVTLRGESDPQVLWDRLLAGEDGFPVSLRWFPNDRDFHIVTLLKVDAEERIHFYNPMRRPLPDGGPARVVHAPGDESVSKGDFLAWFAEREALGYVPQ